MEYTPYFDTLRKTRLLRGMTDAELTLLTESLAPRVRRYDKGELLLMAGYETKDVGIILEGEITATKPMPDGTPITMARMGPGGVFADVLAGGRSKSPVNVTASVCRVSGTPSAPTGMAGVSEKAAISAAKTEINAMSIAGGVVERAIMTPCQRRIRVRVVRAPAG